MTVNGEGTSVNGRDPESGRFVTGNIGGGRPKGSRNKLAEAFIFDLHDEWARSGPDVLKRLARDDPAALVRTVAQILPKEIDASLTVEHVELFAEARNYAEAFRMAQRMIGGELEYIEAEAIEAPDAA
jgi:hypothetical protein